MTSETNFTEVETLGDFLRKTRLERGLDIEQVASETKIPLNIVRAMEGDDHGALPAPAFARGFYNLYAKTLSIKPEEIIERCKSIPNHPLNNSQSYSPQQHKNEATNLAARPSVSFFSIFGTVLVFLLITFAAICWFFSWNPAAYLSKQLRKLDTTSYEIISPEPTITEQPFFTTSDETQQLEEIEPVPSPELTQQDETPIKTGYTLTGTFTVQTTITVSLDDEEPRQFEIQAGETKTWDAVQSITISLPTTSGVNLVLNDDIPITLPTGQPATISIPEFFFE